MIPWKGTHNVAPKMTSTDVFAPAEEKDLVIIGGGVAGYVAAIKAGQEGMKVTRVARCAVKISG